ncbi:MAG: hypothetical protein AAGF85_20670 [Bacteroidota bacterium]
MFDHLFGLYQANKILTFGSLLFLGITVIILTVLPFETRHVLGINLWMKPLKFALSIAIFLFTSIYLLEPLNYSPAKLSVLSWILLGTMIVEIFCIMFQASRGQLSHFNITDPIGRVMFQLMGTAITIAYLVYAIILLDYFRFETNLSPAMLWAIRIGIIIFLFGAISGFSMGGALKHTVGMADGGAGLPFTNWSTVAGDLRVSHFISIHAIQILPLFSVSLAYFDFPSTKSTWAVILIGFLYAIFCVLTLVQAMQGRPFIRI